MRLALLTVLIHSLPISAAAGWDKRASDVVATVNEALWAKKHGRHLQFDECNICGEDGTLTNPDTAISAGGTDLGTCQAFSDMAMSGSIPECASISAIVSVDCCSAPTGGPFPTCEICPDGADVTNPDALLDSPDEDGVAATCEDLQLSGRAGFIPADLCTEAQSATPAACGCGDDSSGNVASSLTAFVSLAMVGLYWVA